MPLEEVPVTDRMQPVISVSNNDTPTPPLKLPGEPVPVNEARSPAKERQETVPKPASISMPTPSSLPADPVTAKLPDAKVTDPALNNTPWQSVPVPPVPSSVRSPEETLMFPLTSRPTLSPPPPAAALPSRTTVPAVDRVPVTWMPVPEAAPSAEAVPATVMLDTDVISAEEENCTPIPEVPLASPVKVRAVGEFTWSVMSRPMPPLPPPLPVAAPSTVPLQAPRTSPRVTPTGSGPVAVPVRMREAGTNVRNCDNICTPPR